MPDIKLFCINNQYQVTELKGSAAKIGKSLQSQIEANLETYLGVRFLATEYSTGINHTGPVELIHLELMKTAVWLLLNTREL